MGYVRCGDTLRFRCRDDVWILSGAKQETLAAQALLTPSKGGTRLLCKMGVYSNGVIYGIRFTSLDDHVLYERIWLGDATPSQIQEVRATYEGLAVEVDIFFYTSCSTTYDIGESAPFMAWWPGDRAGLEKWLKLG